MQAMIALSEAEYQGMQAEAASLQNRLDRLSARYEILEHDDDQLRSALVETIAWLCDESPMSPSALLNLLRKVAIGERA